MLLKYFSPGREFALKTPRRIRRAAGGKAINRQAELLRVPRVPETFAAIVGNRRQIGAEFSQASQVIEQRAANTAVQTAFTLASRVDIPQTQAFVEQPLATYLIAAYARAYWARGPNSSQNRPEVVARVAVVLLRRQGCRARKTAENQQARLRRNQRRQTRQHVSKALILGRA